MDNFDFISNHEEIRTTLPEELIDDDQDSLNESESFLDANPNRSESIIIIHPGSRYLRIGKATDPVPKVIPHVIARRSNNANNSHEQSYFPPIKWDSQMQMLLEETQTKISKTLSSCLTSSGSVRYSVPYNKVYEFNKRIRSEMKQSPNALSWTKTDNNQSMFIGEEALNIKPDEPFHIHWPIRHGHLNVNHYTCGSLTAVIEDLQSLWREAINKHLGITTEEFREYKVFLIISDVYSRTQIREMVNMLLTSMGFAACFLHQESVCATFGAGVSSACVVDVGDQKTSISCIEDGISLRRTRILMEFGGSDLTQLFFHLLVKCGFPYRECNLQSRLDAILLSQLKENFCHINLDVCGMQSHSFQVKHPCRLIQQYFIKVGDEGLVCPLFMFQPELLMLHGNRHLRTQGAYEGDASDPFDKNYLIQTSRRGQREQTEPTGEGGPLDENNEEDMDTGEPPVRDHTDLDVCSDQLLGIDQAILKCIERCESDEVKWKMYSCILIVGGGMLFTGIQTWLQNRLAVQIPIMFRGQEMEIVTKPKDMDPRLTCWKGAALMCSLDTSQDMWIAQSEWRKYGVKILREKLLFEW